MQMLALTSTPARRWEPKRLTATALARLRTLPTAMT
jgi:hypothetical protein